MRVAIVRLMHEFSMDVYANGIISGLRTVRPDWEILDLKPQSIDRKSRSLSLRIKKYYERFWRFPQQVTQQTADIFHIIDPSEGHISYWLKNQNKNVVVTCHDLINFYYKDNLKTSVELPFISRAMWLYAIKGMKKADSVVAVSSLTAKDTTKILDIQPALISVIPNAVDQNFQQFPQEKIEYFRQKQGIDSETLCLLNVGSNHPRKNITNILKAINILKEKRLSFHLWKVGKDFSDEQKAYIQAQGLEDYISYFGKPDKEALLDIYNAADILIAPSLHEGFGMTLLEAMACGTPVITSNVSAMPEVVEDAGLLVDPTNSQEIANAVLTLHKDSTYYQKLVDKGLARVKSFTWEKTAEEIAQIYEKIVNR